MLCSSATKSFFSEHFSEDYGSVESAPYYVKYHPNSVFGEVTTAHLTSPL